MSAPPYSHRTGLDELRTQWLAAIDAGLKQPQKDGVVVNARHAASLRKQSTHLGWRLEKLGNERAYGTGRS